MEIWQEAPKLPKELILISKTSDLKTGFKLKDQIKGSFGSAMDNIAEGFERDGNIEFRSFYLLPKPLQAKRDYNFTGFMIQNKSMKKPCKD